MVSPRYSSASRPTADALIRSGRSLLTSVTRSPSCARFHATARMRVSLSPTRKPDGSESASVWLSSTRMVPPRSPTGTGSSSRPLVELSSSSNRSAVLPKHPQRGPREVAQLRVVPLALELGDDHDGQHHLVLLEAPERPGIGQQDAGV